MVADGLPNRNEIKDSFGMLRRTMSRLCKGFPYALSQIFCQDLPAPAEIQEETVRTDYARSSLVKIQLCRISHQQRPAG